MRLKILAWSHCICAGVDVLSQEALHLWISVVKSWKVLTTRPMRPKSKLGKVSGDQDGQGSGSEHWKKCVLSCHSKLQRLRGDTEQTEPFGHGVDSSGLSRKAEQRRTAEL